MQGDRNKRQAESLHFRMPSTLARAVHDYAEESGLSTSEVVRSALARQFCPAPCDREVGA